MNLRLFVAMVVSALAACSSAGGPQEPPIECAALCEHNVTFTFATPIAGRALGITIGESDGNVLRLDCQRGDAGVACIPVDSRLTPSFDANGLLVSLQLDYPPPGDVAVQITADGAPAAAGAFRYAPVPTVPSTCGDPCFGSQTFTIAN